LARGLQEASGRGGPNLERAVALRPEYIYHRLDLAEVCDMKRYA
jgi:hypothetical protein